MPQLPAPRNLPTPAALAVAIAIATLTLLLLLTGKVNGPTAVVTPADGACRELAADGKVVSRFPKAFASQYTKKMKIRVRPRTGVKKWRVELYTFSGILLGKSKVRKSFMRDGDVAKVKLKQPMQPNKYTLVIKGDVPGCGYLETTELVKLKQCKPKLPLKITNKPKGTASDYGGFLSIGIKPRPGWEGIRKVESVVSDFNGNVYGRAELPKGQRRVIGEVFLHHELTRNLQAGGYSVYITGRAPQPRACGDKAKNVTLKFK